MKNFKIDFTNPWLLLLLIPAAFFTFLPYFRLAKKYRRTRNRVISVTLHAIIMVLSVCLLAGIGLSYDLPNANNELLLVVDVSYSGEKSQDVRDEFVRSVINEAGSGVKVGVVTFGYDQVYAVPLTTNTDKAYNAYLDAEKPDTSASDIASALKYAQGLFNYPETAKIVLVSDGEETDNKAMSEIRAIAAAGIKVDTYCTSRSRFRCRLRAVLRAMLRSNGMITANRRTKCSRALRCTKVRRKWKCRIRSSKTDCTACVLNFRRRAILLL